MKRELKLDLTAFDATGKAIDDLGKSVAKFGWGTSKMRPRPFTGSGGTQSPTKWTYRPANYIPIGEDASLNYLVVRLDEKHYYGQGVFMLILPAAEVKIDKVTLGTLILLGVANDTPTSPLLVLHNVFKYALTEFGERCKFITDSGLFTQVWVPIEVL